MTENTESLSKTISRPPEKAGVFIKMIGLPLNVKFLAIGGYLSVFGLLLIIILLEIADYGSDSVQYFLGRQDYVLPVAVLVFAMPTFIIGWSYLMAGAAAAKARIFLPVLALLALQLFLTNSFSNLLPLILQIMFFVFVLAIYALTFRKRFWQDYPILHFFFWLLALSFFVFLSIGTTSEAAEIAIWFSSNLRLILLLTMFFWVILGLSLFDLGVGIGRWCARFTRQRLPPAVLEALTAFVLLIHPAAIAIIFWITKDGGIMLDFLVSIPMLILAVVLWLLRRWSARMCATLLSLSLALPFIMFSLSMALSGQDFTEYLLNLTGIFPPLLLFIGLTSYNLMSAGVTFTSMEGKVLPRTARVLLYFGVMILVVTCMLFLSNERILNSNNTASDVQELINNSLVLSALVLGIPYLVWLVWKRPEKLIGVETDFSAPPRWNWLERFPARLWLPLSLVLACLGCCTLGAILYWMI